MKTNYQQLSNSMLLFIMIGLIATTSVVTCALLSYFIGCLFIQ